MHEAFAAALESWPLAGIPDKPRPWLISTARFKAIDAMRRRARFDGAQRDLVAHMESCVNDAPGGNEGAGFDGVVGESSSAGHAGVTGRNTNKNPGPYACGICGDGHGGIAGKFDGNVVVDGNAANDAFNSTSHSQQHTGVSANNDAGGYGLWAEAATAGYFAGNVVVYGDALNCA